MDNLKEKAVYEYERFITEIMKDWNCTRLEAEVAFEWECDTLEETRNEIAKWVTWYRVHKVMFEGMVKHLEDEQKAKECAEEEAYEYIHQVGADEYEDMTEAEKRALVESFG
jgi:hypothetical protein